jgi:hypothetical protein
MSKLLNIKENIEISKSEMEKIFHATLFYRGKPVWRGKLSELHNGVIEANNKEISF